MGESLSSSAEKQEGGGEGRRIEPAGGIACLCMHDRIIIGFVRSVELCARAESDSRSELQVPDGNTMEIRLVSSSVRKGVSDDEWHWLVNKLIV